MTEVAVKSRNTGWFASTIGLIFGRFPVFLVTLAVLSTVILFVWVFNILRIVALHSTVNAFNLFRGREPLSLQELDDAVMVWPRAMNRAFSLLTMPVSPPVTPPPATIAGALASLVEHVLETALAIVFYVALMYAFSAFFEGTAAQAQIKDLIGAAWRFIAGIK